MKLVSDEFGLTVTLVVAVEGSK